MKAGLISRAGCIPYNPTLKERARKMRRNMTPAEKVIWSCYLRNHKYLFHRQKTIDHFIVDFYCSKLQLAIEIDGLTHDTNDGEEYDDYRTKVFEGYGINVMRIRNEEVFDNLQMCIDRIEKYIENRENPLTPFEKGGKANNPENAKGEKPAIVYLKKLGKTL